jgi:hypothetical protein
MAVAAGMADTIRILAVAFQAALTMMQRLVAATAAAVLLCRW